MASAEDIGKILAELSRSQSETNDNLQSNESGGTLNIVQREGIVVGGSLRLVRYSLSGAGFVIDHPVYGELDNPSYPFNEGHGSSDGITMPMVMPITFAAGSSPTQVIYETSF